MQLLRELAALQNAAGPHPIDLLTKKTHKQKQGFSSQCKNPAWGFHFSNAANA